MLSELKNFIEQIIQDEIENNLLEAKNQIWYWGAIWKAWKIVEEKGGEDPNAFAV